MSERQDGDLDFEPEVRAAFRRHLAGLERGLDARAAANAMAVRPLRGRAAVRAGRAGRGFGSWRLTTTVAAVAVAVAVIGVSVATWGGTTVSTPGASPAAPSTMGTAVATSSPSSATPTQLDASVVASFGSDVLDGLVIGPDGAAYIIDGTDKTVYRVDLANGSRLPMMWSGQPSTGADATIGRPRLLASVGPDVLVLDDLNNLWRLRAVPDGNGRRTFTKVNIPDNRNWGSGPRAIAGSMVDPQHGLYQLFVVVPADRQIVKYPPAPDGSGFPMGDRMRYLDVDQNVSRVSAIYIDGYVYLLRDGAVEKFSKGTEVDGWRAEVPGKSDLTLVSADNAAMDEGNLLLYDAARGAILEIRKSDGVLGGSFVSPGKLADVTGLAVTTSASNGRTLYWLSDGRLLAASLA